MAIPSADGAVNNGETVIGNALSVYRNSKNSEVRDAALVQIFAGSPLKGIEIAGVDMKSPDWLEVIWARLNGPSLALAQACCVLGELASFIQSTGDEKDIANFTRFYRKVINAIPAEDRIRKSFFCSDFIRIAAVSSTFNKMTGYAGPDRLDEAALIIETYVNLALTQLPMIANGPSLSAAFLVAAGHGYAYLGQRSGSQMYYRLADEYYGKAIKAGEYTDKIDVVSTAISKSASMNNWSYHYDDLILINKNIDYIEMVKNSHEERVDFSWFYVAAYAYSVRAKIGISNIDASEAEITQSQRDVEQAKQLLVDGSVFTGSPFISSSANDLRKMIAITEATILSRI